MTYNYIQKIWLNIIIEVRNQFLPCGCRIFAYFNEDIKFLFTPRLEHLNKAAKVFAIIYFLYLKFIKSRKTITKEEAYYFTGRPFGFTTLPSSGK